MRKTKLYLFIISTLIIFISFFGEKGIVVERLEIPVALGTDIVETSPAPIYKVSILTSILNESGMITNDVTSSKGFHIIETRSSRQLKTGRKGLLGLFKINIISDNTAKNMGLRVFADIWVNNPTLNDRALVAICKGDPETILKYDVKGYSSSAEFIEGMIKNLRQYNFFPMQYTITDIIVRLKSEGRNVLLPYIELKEDGIETTGLAIFKGDRMVGVASINEAKIINLLKETHVKGLLTLENNESEYVNCYTTSKRKATCIKSDGKFKFIINLDLKAQLVTNEFNNQMTKTSGVKELIKFEEEMGKYVEKQCNETLKDLKSKYKVDFLALGRIAAAKYGRNTGVDWNEVVSNSPIEVNVKFKIETEGRGDF